MRNMLLADWYRLRMSTVWYVLFSISCVGAIVFPLCAHLIAKGSLALSASGFTSLFADTQMISLLGCVVIGVIMGSDFENKVVEQVVISGMGRRRIVIEKGILLLGLTSVLLLPYFVSMIVCVLFNIELDAFMNTPWMIIVQALQNGESMLSRIPVILLYIITYTAQLSIGLLFLFLIKKPVLIACLTYVSQLLLGPIAYLNDGMKHVMSYTPYGIDFSSLWKTSSMVISYLNVMLFMIIMIAACYALFRKQDIK